MTSKRQRTATLPTLESPTATSGARETATASAHALTPAELDEYHREGFFIRKALFSTEEAAEVLSCAQSDSTVLSKAHGRMDSDGFISKLSLWNTCGVNIYGALARSARVIDSVEQILGGMTHGFGGTEEAYHYHTKVMIKEARVGGKWEWHQDYGCMHHWGSNSFVTSQVTASPPPPLITSSIALLCMARLNRAVVDRLVFQRRACSEDALRDGGPQ